jgi:hypothetical protein
MHHRTIYLPLDCIFLHHFVLPAFDTCFTHSNHPLNHMYLLPSGGQKCDSQQFRSCRYQCETTGYPAFKSWHRPAFCQWCTLTPFPAAASALWIWSGIVAAARVLCAHTRRRMLRICNQSSVAKQESSANIWWWPNVKPALIWNTLQPCPVRRWTGEEDSRPNLNMLMTCTG